MVYATHFENNSATAQEVYIKNKDYRLLPDIIKRRGEKDYIIDSNEDIDFKFLSSIKQELLPNNNIIIQFETFSQDFFNKCKTTGIKYFWKYSVTSYEDLRNLEEIGVCYIFIKGSIFFDIKSTAKCGVPLRVRVNDATAELTPQKNGITSAWIRPEDLEKYEDFITAVEFSAENAKQEATYYRIYFKDKKWSGDLCLLIKGLNDTKVDNALIFPEFGGYRLNCRQVCKKDNSCHYCNKALGLKRDEIKEYAEKVLHKN